ncbi:MAG: hypothetical protein HY303_16730 [Candidatus Wallbacteria bacterium]|nr:hypothetical protein [Candidatus Wallbacteria bacterium]
MSHLVDVSKSDDVFLLEINAGCSFGWTPSGLFVTMPVSAGYAAFAEEVLNALPKSQDGEPMSDEDYKKYRKEVFRSVGVKTNRAFQKKFSHCFVSNDESGTVSIQPLFPEGRGWVGRKDVEEVECTAQVEALAAGLRRGFELALKR